MASAGDVNGDGFSDLLVGVRYGHDGGSFAGEAYVVFGKASGFGSTVGGRQVIDLTALSAADGFIVQGDRSDDRAGLSVSSAGDLNGDGFDDLIIGAPYGDDGGSEAGEAYVVFGKAGGFGTTINSGGFNRQVIDLSSLSAAEGFIIQGDTSSDRAGWSVSSAGDVNGDGFDDIVVGARLGSDGGAGAGEAYVLFGKAGGFGTSTTAGGFTRQVIDLTSLSAAEGFIIQGDSANDQAGFSVSSAGDVNGDGFADVIVGAPRGQDGGFDAGEAYVLFGKAGGFGTTVTTGGFARQVIDLTSLSAAQGFIIQGDATSDLAGWSVSSAGDVNGDGFADLMVGAPFGNDGGPDAGEAYILFGGADLGAPVLAGATSGGDTLTGTTASERILGGLGNDTIITGGGFDAVLGGAGDDVITATSFQFKQIEGGSGYDTLDLGTSFTGAALDLDILPKGLIHGIERFDLSGGTDLTLTLDLDDVLAIGAFSQDVLGTTRDNVLVIEGDATDGVIIDTSGPDPDLTFLESTGGYSWYTAGAGGAVVLAVEDTLLV